MLLQKACLIYASTPAIHESPCVHIKEGVSKLDNEPICEVINFELTCPECKKIAEINPAHVCDHRIGWRPPMHDPEIVAIAEAAYGNVDHFQREIMGTQVTLANKYIHKEHIKRLRTDDWYEFKAPPDYIMMAIDPATNSLNLDNIRSFFAIVTSCVVDGQIVVKLIIYIYILSNFFRKKKKLFNSQSLLEWPRRRCNDQRRSRLVRCL